MKIFQCANLFPITGRRLGCCLGLWAMLIGTVPAQAAIVVLLGSLDTATTGFVGVNYNAWEAQLIRADEDATPLYVHDIVLSVHVITPNENIGVWIVGEVNNRPDLSNTFIAFDNAPLQTPNSYGDSVTLVPQGAPSEVLLPIATNFWIVIGATAQDPETQTAGLYRWLYSNVSPAASVDGWQVGTSIATAGTGGSGWDPLLNQTPYKFELTLGSEPVPEPAWSIVAVAVATALVVGWRRRMLGKATA
jgi:hypothetical protein